jgi:hypothetical protein
MATDWTPGNWPFRKNLAAQAVVIWNDMDVPYPVLANVHAQFHATGNGTQAGATMYLAFRHGNQDFVLWMKQFEGYSDQNGNWRISGGVDFDQHDNGPVRFGPGDTKLQAYVLFNESTSTDLGNIALSVQSVGPYSNAPKAPSAKATRSGGKGK